MVAVGVSGWRVAGWGLLAAVLAVPAVAMRFTAEVNWTASDFLVMGALLGAVGLGVEWGARASDSGWYRGGMVVMCVGALLLVWVNLAVGIIGSEHDDANLMYAGVLAVGVGGAILARWRASGMARALLATAAAQLLVGAIAVIAGLGASGPVFPRDVLGATAMFAAIWCLAAWCFHRAARQLGGAATRGS